MDLAGGVYEWTGSMVHDSQHRRYRLGSASWDNLYGDIFSVDRLGFGSGGTVYSSSIGGIRLVAPPAAPADLNQDGRVNYFDVSLFIRRFIDGDDRVDFRKDGVLNLDDLRVFIGLTELSAS